MANTRIGQYRLEYEVTGYASPPRQHTIGCWVQPTVTPSVGDLPADIDIQLLGGGTATLQAVALDFLNRIRPMFNSGLVIGSFNLWRYATENSRDFISAGSAVATATPSGSIITAYQTTLTFRCANGGIAKLVVLEGNQAGETSTNLVPNAVGTTIQRFASWALSSVSPFMGLDNSFPVSALKVSIGQNEKLWRKIYRA